MNKLELLSYPLPEAVENMLAAGCAAEAGKLIAKYLEKKETPEVMKARLRLELELMKRRLSYYKYTYEEAEALLSSRFSLYRKGMLSSFMEEGLLDWAFVDNEMRFEEKLLDNAAKRCDVLSQPDPDTGRDLKKRDDCIALIEEKGSLCAEISARISMRICDESLRGQRVHVNLPLARKIEGRQYDVKIIDASDTLISVDDDSVPMRTAVFEKVLDGNDEFSLTFSYRISESLRRFPEEEYVADGMDEYLCEELPHIAFTPYLKALAKEITAGCMTMRGKAEAIYDWITSHVRYSFVRPYALIRDISTYAATSLKGDCGIQAMLFITLCRISGIPAAWESGWYVTDEDIGGHDWARINISGTWFPVDCSFGGGAFRQGNEKRRRHYFGNLDTLRMIANEKCCCTLTGKKTIGRDPTDNQTGEAECSGRILYDEAVSRVELVSYRFLS